MRRLVICFLAFLLLSDIFGQNRNFYNKAKNDRLKSIEYSKSVLNDLKEDNEDQLDKLLIIKEQIRKQREVVNIVNRELSLINQEIVRNENKVKDLTTELELLKKEYADLLYFAYLNIGIQQRMIFILSAKDFNQAYKRIIYLKHLTDYRKSRYQKINNSIIELDSANFSLKKLSDEKGNLAREKASQIDSLENYRKSLNNVISTTNVKISDISEQLNKDAKKKEVIKQVVAKEIESDKKENVNKERNKPVAKADNGLSQSFLKNKKWHIWPLQKFIVLHHFGDYYHPELKEIIVKNDGLELGGSAGSYVHAIFQGTVVNIVPVPGAGTSVILKHGNYFSVYSNVEGVKVSKGDKVEKGQVLAKLGNNKINKLNFQLWESKDNENPEKLDPELWLKKQ